MVGGRCRHEPARGIRLAWGCDRGRPNPSGSTVGRCRRSRVRTSAQRQLVTGLVVNDRRNVPRAGYDRLRAILHDTAVNGPAAANRRGHPDFRAHLLGRIEWVAAGNAARSRKLHEAFAAIRW